MNLKLLKIFLMLIRCAMILYMKIRFSQISIDINFAPKNLRWGPTDDQIVKSWINWIFFHLTLSSFILNRAVLFSIVPIKISKIIYSTWYFDQLRKSLLDRPDILQSSCFFKMYLSTTMYLSHFLIFFKPKKVYFLLKWRWIDRSRLLSFNAWLWGRRKSHPMTHN